MNNYFVMFYVPVAAMDKWKQETPPEERKKSDEQMMKDWQAWMDAHKADIVDNGKPLNKVKRMTAAGVQDVRNDMVYYMIIKADTHDAAAGILKDSPHLTMSPEAYIEVIEIPHMGL